MVRKINTNDTTHRDNTQQNTCYIAEMKKADPERV